MIRVLLLAVALAAPAPDHAHEGRAVATRVQRFYQRAADFVARFDQTSTYPTFGNVKKAGGDPDAIMKELKASIAKYNAAY